MKLNGFFDILSKENMDINYGFGQCDEVRV